MGTMTSRDFSQNPTLAKRAAEHDALVITEAGEPAFVLMTYDDYRRLAGESGRTIVDLLGQGDDGDFDFEPPQLSGGVVQPAALD